MLKTLSGAVLELLWTTPRTHRPSCFSFLCDVVVCVYNKFDLIFSHSTSVCSTVLIAKIDQKQGPVQARNKSGAPLAQIDAPGGGTRGPADTSESLFGSPSGIHFRHFSFIFSTVVFETSLKRSRRQFHTRNGARSGQKGHQNGAEKDRK